MQSKKVTTTKNKKIMAFKAGNNARKKETAQDAVQEMTFVETVLHPLVGDFTLNFLNRDIDKLYASILLYLVENKNKDDQGKKIYERLRGKVGKVYCDVLKDGIDYLKETKIDINYYLLSILNFISPSDNEEYCSNPFIRKVCLGDTSVFAYDIDPVENETLFLTPEEKELLVEINKFNKCSFMKETTLGNLYLNTHIILRNEEKKIERGISDPLGYYTKSIDKEPQVWLLIKKIREESKTMNIDSKYLVADVYIHEMMHRYFDLRPDLDLMKYFIEIEEPMAEFATIKFCEEFDNSKLLEVAKNHNEKLRSDENYIYTLGGDLYKYHSSQSQALINNFRHICMLMHENDNRIQDYRNLVREEKSVPKYKAGDEDVAKEFCNALEKCIDEYNR